MASHRALRGEPHPVRRGVWRSQIRDASGKVISKTYDAKTKREADAIHHAFYAAVKGGDIIRDPTTLIEACDAWLKTKAKIKPSTAAYYRYTIDRYIRPHPIAKVKLPALSTRMLDAHYASLPAGARDAHVVINQALRQAVRWGNVNRNVAADTTKPARARHELAPPPADALDRILTALEPWPDRRLFVELAAYTGCRRGELCALTWGQVDLRQGQLTIDASLSLGPDGYERSTTKTHKPRTIALDATTVDHLREHRARLAAIDIRAVRPASHVFGTILGDKPWLPTTVSRWFKTAARQAGAPDARLHDLRHYHATNLLSQGKPLHEVSRRLGHARPSITLDVYSHAMPATDQGLADAARRTTTG